MKDWFCFYVFVDFIDDVIITSGMLPLFRSIEELLKREPEWFFVRYWEGGPHLRIRIKLLDPEVNNLIGHLERYLLAPNEIQALQRIKSIAYTEYRAEIKRYGDQSTINWAEEQFVASSKIVLKWLNEVQGSNHNPFFFAIRLHLTMFFAMKLTKDEMITLSDLFCDSWIQGLFYKNDDVKKQYGIIIEAFEKSFLNYRQILRPMTDFWNSLDDGTCSGELHSFVETNAAVGRAYENSGLPPVDIRGAYASLIHMTHNRLGIPNRDEAFIAFLLKKCIYYIHEKP